MARLSAGLAGVALLGLVGAGVLVALGVWQLQRLEWKEGLIARIEARLSAAPVAIPEDPDRGEDNFMRVRLEGRLGEGAAFRLTSKRPYGPGFQTIVPVETAEGRRVLADLGYIPDDARGEVLPAPGTPVALTGALFWPEDPGAAPEPDLERNIWFARDVGRMAERLGTEPILVVAGRHDLGDLPLAERIGHGLPNDHFGYAMTWFSLAAVWAVMSGALARRVARRRAAA